MDKLNRHPVDELADLRAEISRLQGRADYLRRMILAGECSTTGDEHYATIREQRRETLDTRALRKELGDAVVRPFLSVSETSIVTIKEGRTNAKA